MKLSTMLGMAGLTLAASLPAAAQTPKVGGLVQVWYTQMQDNNLRINSAAPGGYYNLRSEFKENGFNIRRFELNVSGSITEDISYFGMIDPSINTSSANAANSNASYNPTLFQDLFITYKYDTAQLKVGQFKTLQSYEGNLSSSELIFAERSQLGRVFGDKRDRGAVASYGFGDPKEFGGKLSVGLLNGVSDLASGKIGDTNAQKDYVGRLDFNLGSVQKFGFYTLQGGTDQTDKGGLLAKTFTGGNPPTSADVLSGKDKTTNMGAFYVYQDSNWHFSAEYITGLLGRRFPSVGLQAGAAGREHLDQKFTGYYVTGGYTFGQHAFALRYDLLNYNSGNEWYSAANPYQTSVTDYSPKYTETTLGYTFAFKPELVKAANLKLNYVMRSKNFLKPNALAGQTGEQGGNSLVAAFQVAF